MDKVDADYATAYDRLMKLKQDALIPTVPSNKTIPKRSALDRPQLRAIERRCVWLSQAIEELESLASDTSASESARKRCLQLWSETRTRLLTSTYWAADLEWVVEMIELDPETIQIEPLFVYSHNLRIKAYVDKRVRELNHARMVARRQVEDARTRAVLLTDARRHAEIAENRRRFALAMAAAAQAMQNAQQPQAYAYATPRHSTNPRGSKSCGSDFDCGIGFRCVKANFASTGFCARAVDELGLPTHELPDMESIFTKLPSDSDCKLVTDCPIGFRCDLRSGVCLR